eukprot:Polyplicarium_translucidae@DN1919_c0_g1_i2.p1
MIASFVCVCACTMEKATARLGLGSWLAAIASWKFTADYSLEFDIFEFSDAPFCEGCIAHNNPDPDNWTAKPAQCYGITEWPDPALKCGIAPAEMADDSSSSLRWERMSEESIDTLALAYGVEATDDFCDAVDTPQIHDSSTSAGTRQMDVPASRAVGDGPDPDQQRIEWLRNQLAIDSHREARPAPPGGSQTHKGAGDYTAMKNTPEEDAVEERIKEYAAYMGKRKTLKCPLQPCSAPIHFVRDLEIHLRHHCGIRRGYCRACNATFAAWREFKAHWVPLVPAIASDAVDQLIVVEAVSQSRTAAEIAKDYCNKCGAICTTASHPCQSPPSFVCPRKGCVRKYCAWKSFTSHLREEYPSQRYLCMECGKGFLRKPDARKHAELHVRAAAADAAAAAAADFS